MKKIKIITVRGAGGDELDVKAELVVNTWLEEKNPKKIINVSMNKTAQTLCVLITYEV